MWLRSSWGKTLKAFGVKWPKKPIKAPGVYYSYYNKFLPEKNFIERLDSI